MTTVTHEGQQRSFALCILRGDGWGCCVLSDGICRQIRCVGGLWETTGVIDNLADYFPPGEN